jgi:dolichol kinase
MHLAYSVSLSALIGIEFIRLSKIEPLHKRLNSFMSSFTNKQRDSGPIILSHFYLLIGCALPLWLCSIINIDHWAAFSGIISLGIGDSVVFLDLKN